MTRKATVTRNTRETQITLTLDLDGTGKADLHTGIGFFDHMLDGFARHGLFDLAVTCRGDLEVDCHHTIEDVGIALGTALREALGDKAGLVRYGSCLLPMDETLALCAVDLGGRPYFVYDAQFAAPASTLADQDGVAELLVEGTFAPDAVLTVRQEELPAKKVEGCTPRCVWSYAVTGSQSPSVTVRIRAEGVKRPEAAVYQDGAWSRVDSTLDGSYLVLSGPVEGKVMLMEGPSSMGWAVALAAAGAAALLGGGLWLRRRWHAGRAVAGKS